MTNNRPQSSITRIGSGHEPRPDENRKDHGPENLTLLRRLALNLAKLQRSRGSMRGKLKRAGWDNAVPPNSSR